jgi:nucleotide-binding universal stress UspA family protein
MYKKILLATDGSENSIAATKRVIELAKESKAEVAFFYSENHHPIDQEITMPFPKSVFGFTSYMIPSDDYRKIKESLKAFGERIIRETQMLFENAGIPAKGELIVDRDPADYAKMAVEKDHYDLVVVGCKGHHSRLRKALIGTVAEKISNEVGCDVLIVR